MTTTITKLFSAVSVGETFLVDGVSGGLFLKLPEITLADSSKRNCLRLDTNELGNLIPSNVCTLVHVQVAVV